MANYNALSRTNYFHVTSEEAFNNFAQHLIASEDDVKTFKGADKDGNPTYGFYAYDSISYISDLDDDDWYENICEEDFIKAIQEIIAPDDAFILTEIGNEKMRYLVGYSLVVTKDDYRSVNLANASITIARELLNNDTFTTELNY